MPGGLDPEGSALLGFCFDFWVLVESEANRPCRGLDTRV
jgi:hypothetical protein